MRYPSWFPSPKSWNKAFGVLLCFLPAILSIRMLGEMSFNLFHITPNPESRKFWVWLAFTLLFPPVMAIAGLHHLCFGREGLQKPRWMPRWPSWYQGIIGWIILFVSGVFTLLLYLPFASGRSTGYHYSGETQTLAPFFYPIWESLPSPTDLSDPNDWIGGFIWLSIAAYLYHFQEWAGQFFAPKPKPKVPKTRPRP